MQRFAIYCCVLAGLLVTAVSSTRADIIAFQDNSGFFGTPPGLSVNMGRRFTVSAPIFVTQLGIFDRNTAINNSLTGLTNSHDVTLFSLSNATSSAIATSLTTVSVPAGIVGTYSKGYRFASITPYLLTPGVYAVVGYGLGAGGADDYATSVGPLPTGIVTGLVGDVYTFGGGPSPEFPDFKLADINSHPSASFAYTAVPEPTAGFLAGAAMLGFLGYRRRCAMDRLVK